MMMMSRLVGTLERITRPLIIYSYDNKPPVAFTGKFAQVMWSDHTHTQSHFHKWAVSPCLVHADKFFRCFVTSKLDVIEM